MSRGYKTIVVRKISRMIGSDSRHFSQHKTNLLSFLLASYHYDYHTLSAFMVVNLVVWMGAGQAEGSFTRTLRHGEPQITYVSATKPHPILPPKTFVSLIAQTYRIAYR